MCVLVVDVGLRGSDFRKKKATSPLYLLLSMLKRVWQELCERRRRASSSRFFFFHVAGEGSVGVDAQQLLVASSSGCVKRYFGVVVASGRSATTTSWMLQGGLEFQMLLTLAYNR
jgi:hypothetical protein